jgi:2-polyprenyl-3-methyl-5-hydroxy-6-metoxy-1,4-benzoquinol methylase
MELELEIIEPTAETTRVNDIAEQGDVTASVYQKTRMAHWDRVAQRLAAGRIGIGGFYHTQLAHYYSLLVPPGMRVLEVGCGTGDLLAALKPTMGVGIDFSKEMVQQARQKHPELRFVQADAHDLLLDAQFDVIILSDLVNDVWDVQGILKRIVPLTHSRTRLIVNTYSNVWAPLLALAQRVGLSKPNLALNWLTPEDITNLLRLTDFEMIKHTREILFPLPVPVLSNLANRFLVKLWPFYLGALTNILIARPTKLSKQNNALKEPRVSIIIPARNEAGNIECIFNRTPTMGGSTELIFVEGHSRDDTYAAIERAIRKYPQRPCKLLKQSGQGKGDAVRMGFTAASGDILMILDADLTVPPEDLTSFYEALVSGNGEFVNGVRLVYPMERQAMRFINLLGNKFFSLAFSWLLGQPIKDTLCGTKVLWKKDYELIAANRAYFGDFDPFGDFDLLFGAAKLNLKIVDLPIRYRERTYGTTNIQRWKHAWLLLRMVLFAARRMKFV